MKMRVIAFYNVYGDENYNRVFDTNEPNTMVKTPDDAIRICAESICVNHARMDTFIVLDEDDNVIRIKRGEYNENPRKATIEWVD